MTLSRILVHQISYKLPTGQSIFDKLSLTFSRRRIGLVGKNGSGKTTLLKLLLGELLPYSGSIQVEGKLVYVPQEMRITQSTVAGLFGCEEKINALSRIQQGSTDLHDFAIVGDEWNITTRMQQLLIRFGLEKKTLDRSVDSLSGGELTRVLIAKCFCTKADFILLDEPTNHLDITARQQLYAAIEQWQGGLIVASHDRVLLNLMDEIVELSTLGATSYGGNYDFYQTQKGLNNSAAEHRLEEARKSLKQVQCSMQSSSEKHSQRLAKGRKDRRREGQPKMLLDARKGRSEKTQSTLLVRHSRMLKLADQEVAQAKNGVEITEEIHVNLAATTVPKGKVILNIEDLTFCWSNTADAIIKNFNLKLQGPERVALVGKNGSGKTTLIRLILGELIPTKGKIEIGTQYISYLDQNTCLLNPNISILDNYLLLNPDAKEHTAYASLAQFLFKNVTALKKVKDLSSGEKLRATLACTMLSAHPPQLLILDEPTNHLDLASIRSIESALRNYQGTLIVVSHDQAFLEAINVMRIVDDKVKA